MMNGKQLRVLVADGYEDSASALALLLGQWGHRPRTAFDGRNALALVERWWPDVAIIDTGMPVLSGYEVALQICRLSRAHETRSQPFLVAISEPEAREPAQRASHAGFDIRLLKPVNLPLLKRMLSALSKKETVSL